MDGLHVVIREIPKERGGGYEAEVLELPGVFVIGNSIEEVKAKIVQRIESWLRLSRRLGWVVNIDYSLQEVNGTFRSMNVC